MPPFRIACLEADPDVRDILSIVLSDVGEFAPRFFDEIEDALFELPTQPPDFILLDPTLESGMSSVDFCSLLMDHPFLKDVPVAFLGSGLIEFQSQ